MALLPLLCDALLKSNEATRPRSVTHNTASSSNLFPLAEAAGAKPTDTEGRDSPSLRLARQSKYKSESAIPIEEVKVEIVAEP